MKISKVNHVKTAVGKTGASGMGGILYVDPSSRSDGTNPDKLVNDRTSKTKILYSVFDNTEGRKDIENSVKKLTDDFNNTVRELKYNRRIGKDEEITDKLTASNLLDRLRKKNSSYSENTIEDAVNILLKKTLRRAASKNALKTLLSYAYGNRSGAALSDEDADIIYSDFILKLVDDYNKTSIRKNTPKALKHQNMIVQPDEEHIFIPAKINGASERKKQEKDAFSSFLVDYANLDKEERTTMLTGLRRIVNLYFYGEGSVNKESFDVWADHDAKKAQSGYFAEVVKKTVKKGDKEVQQIDVDATRENFRTRNIECYRNSMEVISADGNNDIYFKDKDISKFWIHHIEGETERLYSKIKADSGEYCLKAGYISEKVWKGLINYLSIKYISIGKAVYNYALTDIGRGKKELDLGKIGKDCYDGISSFDYERIKAEETLQREVAVYVAFATNHLSNTTVNLDTDEKSQNTDLLLLNREELERHVKDRGNIVKDVLQFFGGKSQWERFFDDRINDTYDEISFLYDIKQIIYSLRNQSFHFATENIDDGNWNTALIGDMFEYDCRNVNTVEKNKFYSNNLPLFYSEASLEKTLHRLYDKYHERASQVPSFNSVFVRKNFPEILREHHIIPTFSCDDMNKWYNAVYYLYKEIYYNAFLQDESALDLFLKFVEKLNTEEAPNKDFKGAIDHYKHESDSLAMLCQFIMTEHNRQNGGNQKKKSSYTESKKPAIYQHYKMILLLGLREAFFTFLGNNKDVFGFISSPTWTSGDKKPEEEFLPDYVSGQYDSLVSAVKAKPELQKWYIMARFLSPKQVNHLTGSFKSYKQYVKDIERRARETGNRLKLSGRNIDLSNIIKILSVCTKLNGTFTKVPEDYFSDADAYAEFVAKFLDYNHSSIAKELSAGAAGALAAFCDSKIDDEKIGIFHDGTNLVPNRNVMLCRLYGSADIIAARIPVLKEDDIKEYFRLKKENKGLFERQNNKSDEKGKWLCKDAEEQLALKKYQEVKNKVELRDIVEYSEILDELQGQLINWVFMRERDLMYFQLGFHYMCLNNDSKKPEGYRNIKSGDISIDGAILYQIAAMYTGGLPIYYKENGEYIERIYNKDKKTVIDKPNANVSIGTKVPYFFMYGGVDMYSAGLELFENVEEHDNCVKLRGYIEHFEYFAKQERNMFDIYSEVFDRFFTYDMKYKKNVINLMYNILLSHFIVTSYEFGTGTKDVGEKKNVKKKEMASFTLRAKNGISSDKFTYILADNTKLDVCAKSKEFLDNVARILYYPLDPPEELIRDPENENARAKVTGTKDKGKPTYNTKSGNKKGNERKNGRSTESNNSIGTSLGDLLANIKFD